MARREWAEGADMARQITNRHPEVFADAPNLCTILFVWDDDAAPMDGSRPVVMRLAKVPGKLVDFVLDGKRDWMLEYFALHGSELTPNQVRLCLAHHLLLFAFDPTSGKFSLREPAIQQHEAIFEAFGHRWLETKGDVADILSDEFRWGKVGQSRLDVVAAIAKQRQQLVDVINSGGPIGVAPQRIIEAEGPPPRNKAPN